MITKIIPGGFAGLSRAFAKLAAEEPVIIATSMMLSAPVLERNVKKTIGDKSKLAALSQFTQDDRTAMGYSPDEPLLRDASLLRDHIESAHSATEAGVGSNEPVQLYSELGFLNSRTGTSVEPRPALKIGVLDSEAEVVAIFETAIGLALK